MAINKVVDRNNNTLIDLTFDTVTPEKVLAGETFHDKYGNVCTGSLTAPPSGELDISKYNFIDYEGTLLYTYTDAELDALTTLPIGADHTGENLTFQGWNWSLEDLKAWNRERPDRPIVGAHYITTDGKSYLYLDTPLTGATLSFSKSGTLNSVDWGDGTVDTNTSHTYANPGQYIIVIDMADGYWYFGSSSASKTTNKQYVKNIKLGRMTGFASYAFGGCHSLTSITIPNSVTSISGSAFSYCSSLTSVTIGNGVTSIGSNAFVNCNSLTGVTIPDGVTSFEYNIFNSCHSLTSIVIPDGVTSIGGSAFESCKNLTSITIPDSVTSSISSYTFSGCSNLTSITIGNGVTSIGSNAFYQCPKLTSVTIPGSVTSIASSAFQQCYNLRNVKISDGVTSMSNSVFANCNNLRNINIPDSVTSIGNNAFNDCIVLTLDLSKQTKVISLTSTPWSTTYSQKILVPASLLEAYKSASYWSNYADIMVGV